MCTIVLVDGHFRLENGDWPFRWVTHKIHVFLFMRSCLDLMALWQQLIYFLDSPFTLFKPRIVYFQSLFFRCVLTYVKENFPNVLCFQNRRFPYIPEKRIEKALRPNTYKHLSLPWRPSPKHTNVYICVPWSLMCTYGTSSSSPKYTIQGPLSRGTYFTVF